MRVLCKVQFLQCTFQNRSRKFGKKAKNQPVMAEEIQKKKKNRRDANGRFFLKKKKRIWVHSEAYKEILCLNFEEAKVELAALSVFGTLSQAGTSLTKCMTQVGEEANSSKLWFYRH